MKSKNLDYKMSKQSIQNIYNQKKNRKQTKPKRNNKVYPGQQNDTQSDNNNFSIKKSKKYKNVDLKNENLKRIQKMRCSITEQSNTSNNEQKNINKNKVLKIPQKRNSQNFIGELNSYLHELKRSKLNLNQMGVYTDISKSKTLQIPLKSNKNQTQQLLNQNQNTLVVVNSDRLQKKIKKQKSINLNLQKCIVEIQKVLWQRNQKLEALQQQLHRKCKPKLNYSKNMNQIDRNNLGKTIFFNRDLTSKSQQIPKVKKNIIYNEQYYPPEQESFMNEVSKISSRKNANHELDQDYSQKQQKKTNLLRFKEKKITDLTRFKLKQDQFSKFREKRINKKTQRFDNNGDLYLKNNIQWKQFDLSKRQKSYNKFQKHQNFF